MNIITIDGTICSNIRIIKLTHYSKYCFSIKHKHSKNGFSKLRCILVTDKKLPKEIHELVFVTITGKFFQMYTIDYNYDNPTIIWPTISVNSISYKNPKITFEQKQSIRKILQIIK